MKVTIVKRFVRVKTYHPNKGDALLEFYVGARSDRPLDDPWFGEQAKKECKSKRLGMVVEWVAFA